MLTLGRKLTLNKEVILAPNLCDRFDEEDLQRIGNWVSDGFKQDKESRAKWEKRTSAAMDLAMQVMKAKNFPWPNCANIAFPLVTIAALQFHARAYPTLVSGTDVVRCRVIGEDPTGEKRARADRISCHMSYQLLEQDKSWEEQHDRMLINLPIVGCAFKKSYYSSKLGHNTSEMVQAADLVMNYYAKSTESCARKTHIIPLFRNDIYEQVQRKTYVDVLDSSWYRGLPQRAANTEESERNRRTGVQPPAQADETTPFVGLEQHCSMDLDQDGYAEPYIVTLEKDSQAVLRIVARFDREEDIERTVAKRIIKISPMEYFTKYSFVPSPDGSVYDTGFGVFLGPLNESVNSIVNQLVDAGTLQTTAGGFLGRGAKIRGGVYTFSPFGWQRVDSTGDDLQKSVFPFPVREPSAVLFQLLSLLINYTQRISGSTDIMVGENIGQNTPKGTADMLQEQGQKIYNSIFKRVWRGSKEEFKKLYVLNGIYLPESVSYGDTGKQKALRSDYLGNPDEVVPAADPNITSDQQAINQAVLIKQSAMTTPGYDKDEVEKRFLKANRVEGIETLFPGTKGAPPPEDPKLTIEKLKQQGNMSEWQAAMRIQILELQEEKRLNDAQIYKIQADILLAQEDTAGDAEDRKIALINAQLGMLKARGEVVQKRIDVMLKGMELQGKHIETQHKGIELETARAEAAGLGGMEGGPGNKGSNGSRTGAA